MTDAARVLLAEIRDKINAFLRGEAAIDVADAILTGSPEPSPAVAALAREARPIETAVNATLAGTIAIGVDKRPPLGLRFDEPAPEANGAELTAAATERLLASRATRPPILGNITHGERGYRKGCRCPRCCRIHARVEKKSRSKEKPPEAVAPSAEAPEADPVAAKPQPAAPPPAEAPQTESGEHGLASYWRLKCRCARCCEANRVATRHERRTASLAAFDPAAVPSDQHGTEAVYRRGCRCDPCREANRIYFRKYYASTRKAKVTKPALAPLPPLAPEPLAPLPPLAPEPLAPEPLAPEPLAPPPLARNEDRPREKGRISYPPTTARAAPLHPEPELPPERELPDLPESPPKPRLPGQCRHGRGLGVEVCTICDGRTRCVACGKAADLGPPCYDRCDDCARIRRERTAPATAEVDDE